MKLAIGSDERTHLTDVVIEEVKRAVMRWNYSGH